ncbi:MAG: hypothetical protein QNJ17_14515 [Desulfocapsaceae bacterium]|nr:hypothetical protein [Desulfocapsaceae bacterium]
MVNLKNVMRLNATSCLVFGLTFVIIPESVVDFLAQETQAPSLIFIILGIALFGNGIHLLWAAARSVPGKLLVLYFSIGDFLWVVATLLLVLAGVWITAPAGIAVSLAVAMMVGTFGFLQMTKREE